MKKSLIFPIIVLIAWAMGQVHADAPATKLIENSNDEPYLTIDQEASDGRTSFRAILYDQCEQELGKVIFNYNAQTRSGYIESLHIYPNHRKKSFGSTLLTFALQTLTECKCIIVTWLACPFNLRDGENAKTMLPKLVAFYQKHGGVVTHLREATADIAYYPNATTPAA